MRYYPFFLNLNERTCLVVGGGKVGARKARRLLSAGARVIVVSQQMDAALEALQPHERLRLERRDYHLADMQGVFLAFAATDDTALNQRIQKDAMGCQVLCNIADRPELCDFIMPAVVEKGDLALAITTAGNSPALAKRLRRQLADQLGPEYARLTELLGAIRRRLLSKGHDPEAHQKVFNTLLDGDLLGLVRNDRRDAIDALLDATLGPDYRLENLLAEAKQTPNSGSITPKKSDNRQTSASGRKVE